MDNSATALSAFIGSVVLRVWSAAKFVCRVRQTFTLEARPSDAISTHVSPSNKMHMHSHISALLSDVDALSWFVGARANGGLAISRRQWPTNCYKSGGHAIGLLNTCFCEFVDLIPVEILSVL
jgi:hypothetical protein